MFSLSLDTALKYGPAPPSKYDISMEEYVHKQIPLRVVVPNMDSSPDTLADGIRCFIGPPTGMCSFFDLIISFITSLCTCLPPRVTENEPLTDGSLDHCLSFILLSASS